MEKVKKYKSIVRKIIEQLGENRQELNSNGFSIKYQSIIDEENGNYILLRDGWKGTRRFYGNIVHIEVVNDGMVWLQEDRTDLIVADMLLDAGIPKEEIVLGFHPPIVRPDTEFAVG